MLTLELLVGVIAVEAALDPLDTSFNELDEILESEGNNKFEFELDMKILNKQRNTLSASSSTNL